ncbi:DNA mismatch repair protein Mlh1, partial [Rhizoctonia solani AG-3 Rhs1AP]
MLLVGQKSLEKSSNPESVPTIRRLDETLVNRIAAGEIIHRPASALKELIENALDAGATSIKVTAKDGGMKMLQIQDNGCGIRKSDLPILCERFTTSKLREFSDLQEIATYGFRGEALASISFVSHLSVVTKTRSDACAWRALYEDGVLLAPKEGAAAEAVACAGNDGTVTTAEDLFYNTPVRKASLRNPGEEYSRISDVVTRYAIHQAGVSFMCKKAGATSPDVSTPLGASRSSLIRLLFGAGVADALSDLEISSSDVAEQATGKRKRPKGDVDAVEESWSESDDEAVPVAKRDDKTTWKANAVFTNTSFQGKKLALLLFINHRLVESRRIQRGIEAVYSTIMPKGAHPFVYLSSSPAPAGRTTVRQTVSGDAPSDDPPTSSSTNKVASSTKLSVKSSRNEQVSGEGLNEDEVLRDSIANMVMNDPDQEEDAPSIANVSESECFLTSVSELRQQIQDDKHSRLTDILHNSKFVGMVDFACTRSLLQHELKLYLVNHSAVAEELFYQLGLRQFGNFSLLKLSPPPPLHELVHLAVEDDTDIHKAGLDPKKIGDAS